jgi:endonuclease-3
MGEVMVKNQVNRVFEKLYFLYPEAQCSLFYRNAYELLVATLLSAQCTDKRVNQITPAFFERFSSVKKLSEAKLENVQSQIQSVNFYRNKAKHLLALAKQIVQKHDAQVPQDLASLVALPGVGRKTANVVLANSFGIPAMVVDTHVKRLCFRLGLTRQTDPEEIEKELMGILESKKWTLFSHLLISHGRAVCVARNPRCHECVLKSICPCFS